MKNTIYHPINTIYTDEKPNSGYKSNNQVLVTAITQNSGFFQKILKSKKIFTPIIPIRGITASRWILLAMMSTAMILASCKSMNRTQKGAAIGTASGGAAGAVIGRTSGNTALGAIIGAAVGGATGAIIGRQMDKQAEEIEKEIPGVIVSREGEGILVEFTNEILFGFDSSTISADAQDNLDKLVTILNKYPDTDIVVQGHTDDIGTNRYNQNLSEKRSIAVADYLITEGITPERLTAVGFGESSPKYENTTEQGRDKNRRVEFVITANEDMIEKAEKESEGAQ